MVWCLEPLWSFCLKSECIEPWTPGLIATQGAGRFFRSRKAFDGQSSALPGAPGSMGIVENSLLWVVRKFVP